MDYESRMLKWNNLVVRVIRAETLQLKNHKNLDIYVSLVTGGKGCEFKSKVKTDVKTTTDGSAHWDESCEFQLSELENELQVSVCHKGKLGRTETLGSLNFDLSLFPQFQPPKCFKLTKKGSADKERGSLYLGFEFSNKVATSISSFSINTLGKGESKLDKIKRKMHIGKRRPKDAQSLASVSLSRRSSFSSITSGLAFNSPSPNQMRRKDSFDDSVSLAPAFERKNSMRVNAFATLPRNSQQNPPALTIDMPSSREPVQTPQKGQLSPAPSMTSIRSEIPSGKQGFRSKMKERAEKLLHPHKHRKNSDVMDTGSLAGFNIGSPDNRRSLVSEGGGVKHREPQTNLSRPTSIASSSGFASLGSSGHNASPPMPNSNTSSEHLCQMIEHLKKENRQKEEKIKDLEGYLDKLLSRVIEKNPELLQTMK
uniref:FIP-RBD domain-containing protein n=1 Tax=Panagrellus redivivus TaxID=6233 RepID=A0A7E4VCU9_PANRE